MSVTADLEEALTCPVCFGIYENPRSLPCLHCFCLGCLERLPVNPENTNFIFCPMCRIPTELPDNGAAGFPVAFRIVDLVERLARMRAEPRVVRNCRQHGKPLDIFCESDNCNVLICTDGTIQTHRGHTHSAIKDAYDKHTRLFKASINSVEVMEKDVIDFIDNINVRVNEVKEQGELAKAEVHLMVEEMIAILHQSEGHLINEIENVASGKVQLLQDQRILAEKRLNSLNELKGIVKNKLEIVNYSEFLECVKETTDRIAVQACEVIDTDVTERADIMLIKNMDIIHSLCNIGTVTTQTQMCKIKHFNTRDIVISKDKISFPLSIEKDDFSILEVPLSSLHCKVVTTNNTLITTNVTARMEPGIFEVHCSPVARGKHQVNVHVNNVPIQCIELSIPFNPYIQNITPLRTIECNGRPWGITEINGYLVITEHNRSCISVMMKDAGTKVAHEYTRMRFSEPCGIGIAPGNSIIVANDHKVQKIAMSGQEIAVVSTGRGEQAFDSPGGVAILPNGFVYVADCKNNRIKVLLADDLSLVDIFGRAGDGIGMFRMPHDIAYDSQEYIYVADTYNHRIQKFIGHDFVLQFGTYGSGPQQFKYPCGVAVDSNDVLYVSDTYNNRICMYTSDGIFICCFGSKGNESNQFKNPHGVMFDSEGHFFVCDHNNKRIVVY